MRQGVRRNHEFRIVAVSSIFAGILLLAGCVQEPAQKSSVAIDPVLLNRQEKDRAFKSGPESPIPEEERGRFQGLAYYPLAPNLRLTVKLNRHPTPQSVRLGTNTGEIRRALRYGYFEFQIEGQTCRLQAYRIEDDPPAGGPSLFIPFRDATSGKETYPGGRYLDLPENTSGVYELDFNRAYNPSCAYGKGFSCPVPPAENTLPVPVMAGEKNFPLATAH